MERKLKEAMESGGLDVFETLNLAIQLASRQNPTELASHRDRIIEGLYRSPDERREDAARVSDKKAQVAMKGCAGSRQHPSVAQDLPRNQRELTNAKGKGILQFTERPAAAPRNATLRISEVPSRPAQGNARTVPVGTSQRELTNAKGKGIMQFTARPVAAARNVTLRISELPSRPTQGNARTVPVDTSQRELTNAKGKGILQFTERPAPSARNATLRISEVPSRPAQGNARTVPVGTGQGQSSAAKGKGKAPCTEFVARHATGLNMRNNQVRPSDTVGKNTAPRTDKAEKHGGSSSKLRKEYKDN